MTTSPLHDPRWAVALALVAGACAEPRKLTLRIAQVESVAGPLDAALADGGTPWCERLAGAPDRTLVQRYLYYNEGDRDLCVAFVAHPEDDQRELLQAHVLRVRRVSDREGPPCLGPLGMPLANALGEEADYLAAVVVIDLERPLSDYLLTRRAVPKGDEASVGTWCLDGFGCSRLFPWVHDEVVRRCMAAPIAPAPACSLRQESPDVCPTTRLPR